MRPIWTIAIDPGAKGGVALLFPDGTIEAYKLGGDETIEEILKGIVENARMCEVTVRAVIEQVHSMPGQGVASSFKFGENFGNIKGLLYGLGIPYELVTPQKWQKIVPGLKTVKQVGKTAHKRALKEHAQRLYPTIQVTLATADALLIAHWAKEQGRQVAA
jgi:crossover junction endodeoxyribonuclease RuvC